MPASRDFMLKTTLSLRLSPSSQRSVQTTGGALALAMGRTSTLERSVALAQEATPLAGGTPMPVHQLLVYPVTNSAFDTPTYQEHQEAVPPNRPLMEWFWNRHRGADRPAVK